MRRHPISLTFFCAAAIASALPQAARSHFIWITARPAAKPGETTIRAFFNEDPEPDAKFVKYARDLAPTVDGQPVPSTVGEESRDARWVGKAPTMVDAERDLGVMTRGDKSHRLVYTARAQSAPIAPETREAGDKLRARLIEADKKPWLEVLFAGKPVARARIKTYPDSGESAEIEADERGRASVDGLTEGKTALWASWADGTPGEEDGKAFAETRYYATLTYVPPALSPAGRPSAAPTTFATMPEPAVNSFGGAVLGKWLYVYGGHLGPTHRHSVETTARHFRRLDLEDRTTWEELPMGKDLQGVALVSDGRALYRTGGMAATNKPGDEQDMHSVAEFARFDPETKSWSELAPMPEPRSTHDSAVVGRTLFVAGGWTMKGESVDSTFPGTTLAFDLDHPESGWRAIPQPFRRRALSVAEHGGRLYVLGGLVGGGMDVDRRVDVLDPKTDSWSRGPDLPAGGRAEGFGTSAFAVDGRLYSSGTSGRIHRLADSGGAWEAVGAWSRPRITHRLLPGPAGSLLAVGGNFKGKQTPVIESVIPGASSPAAGRPAGPD